MSVMGANMAGSHVQSAMTQAEQAQRLETARAAAEDLVSIALVQPILKELRDTNQAAGPFAPGAGEKAFGPLLDAAMSKQIVQGQNLGVVDAIAEQIASPGRDVVMWSRARAGIETQHEARDGS